jgi:hypothetical protein
MGEEFVLFPYVVEYYSAIKKTEIILFSGKWMEIEIIIVSTIS